MKYFFIKLLERKVYSDVEKINFTFCKRYLKKNSKLLSEVNVMLLVSPNLSDYIFYRLIFRKAIILCTNKFTWDLHNRSPFPDLSFDLIVINNVLMYSSNPKLCIKNLLKSGGYIFILDQKFRKRSKYFPYLGFDGDKTRFSIGNVKQLEQPTFNLSFFSDLILDYHEFIGHLNSYHKKNMPPIHIFTLLGNKKNLLKVASTKYNFSFIKRVKYSFILSKSMEIFFGIINNFNNLFL